MGREEHYKEISLAWEMLEDSATLGLPQLRVCALSQFTLLRIYVASVSSLSEAGPGLHALPRSKLLR